MLLAIKPMILLQCLSVLITPSVSTVFFLRFNSPFESNHSESDHSHRVIHPPKNLLDSFENMVNMLLAQQ